MPSLRVLADWDIPPRERVVLNDWPAGIEIIEGGSKLGEDEKLELAPSIDVHAGQMRTVTAPYLRAAEGLQLVHMTGHGVDGLLRDGIPDILRDAKIRVATADAAAIPIAEFAIMAMIALSRQLLRAHQALSERGEWAPTRGPELYGRTAVVVGLGSIGSLIAERAKGLGMNVGGVTQHPHDHAEDGLSFVLPFDRIEEAVGSADYVVLAAPLTAVTERLIDSRTFAAMRRGCFLVNIGRGPIVDEAALVQALSAGILGGAALDGWWCEEDGHRSGYPAGSPLHQYNVIMTPHYAGSTFETRSRALQLIGVNAARIRDGAPVINEVTIDELVTMGRVR
jgi:phosphoglycerate dehydrogenase-like enzyme